MKCPNCQHENPEDSTFCGKCATRLGKEAQPSFTKTIETSQEELTSGTRLSGRYQIIEELGQGGMGHVYRAEDTSLSRPVAIKVLPEEFASDPERLARFEREARLLAVLNHPNIASIHGIEEYKGKRFLVLELAEGETLHDRLDRGPLPLDEALETCKQIAEGLEAAHEKGIIHRDLKPGNIMISSEGKVKILDFGLAKAYSGETSVVDIEKSPTITAEMTRPGIVMGTAAYMSPEQAKGRAVDKRTDVWAFGCILFECLTGKRAFEGETTSEIIASILKGEPGWKDLPSSIHTPIRSLIQRCLQKDKNRRQHDISDARIEIEEALAGPADADRIGALAARKFNWRQVIPILGAVVITALIMTIIPLKKTSAPTNPLTKLEMSVEPAKRLGGSGDTEQRVGYWRPSRTSIAISPDGSMVVFQGVDENGSRLYRRFLDKGEAEPISGTEGGRDPFFSPDGKQIGFYANGKLMKVPTGGGISTDIFACGTPYGASWGSDNFIVHSNGTRLWRTPAAGGNPEILTEPNRENGEIAHLLPHVLPGGKAILFSIRTYINTWYDPHIAVLSLETKKWELVIDQGADARYSPSGHIVFARQGKLMAAPFDLDRLKVTDEARPVLPNIMQAINATNDSLRTFAAQYCFSDNGTMAFVPGGGYPDNERKPVWVDRNGAIKPLGKAEHYFYFPRVSLVQKKIAYMTFGKNEDIWIYDMKAGFYQPVLRSRNRSGLLWPLWTPDAKYLTYQEQSPTHAGIYWVKAEGIGEPELLIENGSPGSWSPDGRSLALVRFGSGTSADIWIFSLEDKKAEPFINSQSYDAWPEFSPDGRFLAYASNITGRYEVYVTPYPGYQRGERVSIQGGHSPVWSSDMRELYYLEISQSPRAKMIVAEISTDPFFRILNRRVLFDIWGLSMNASPHRGYDLLPDGQGFVCGGYLFGGKAIHYSDIPQDILSGLATNDMKSLAWFEKWLKQDKDHVFTPQLEMMLQGLVVTKINIIQNWFEELKRLVPAGK